jgi:hypothetical protein
MGKHLVKDAMFADYATILLDGSIQSFEKKTIDTFDHYEISII